MKRTTILLSAPLLWAAPALAQGPSFLNPEPISGIGSFPFDTTGFTPSLLSMSCGIGTQNHHVSNTAGSARQKPTTTNSQVGYRLKNHNSVSEHAKLPNDMVIMTCIAKECPNHIFTGNRVKSRHTPNEDFVTYTRFE